MICKFFGYGFHLISFLNLLAPLALIIMLKATCLVTVPTNNHYPKVWDFFFTMLLALKKLERV